MARPHLVVALFLLVVSTGCSSPVAPDSSIESTTPAGESTPIPSSPAPPTDTDTSDTTESERTSASPTRPGATATVTDVVDGDTVKVRYANGTGDTVRLLGVDTPEVFSENTPDEFEGVPETEAGRQCLRRFGERASSFAEAELAGETVRLTFDENEGRRGYYDRLLAYVYVDGEQFNYRLVAEGYARMYDSNFVERERYAAAERTAQEANRGLWTCRTPSTGTSDETVVTDGGDGGDGNDGDGDPLSVSVHADAAGDDRDNLDDEYVVLTNTGSSTLDVGGWTVADAAGHVYTLSTDSTLEPGASLTIHTGSGTDTDTDRYWGRQSPVWNNDGDTVTVRDESDDVVVSRTYE